MIVLGIETSAKWAGAALAGESGLLGVIERLDGGRTEQLQAILEDLFSGAGIAPADLDGVAVSLGPGSFTGLRIGLGAAKGVSLARGCPLVGVRLLPILARNVEPWEGLVSPWIDVGRGEVFGGAFRSGQEVAPAETRSPADHLRSIGEEGDPVLFVGSGSAKYRTLIEEIIGSRARFAEETRSLPSAGQIALTGRNRILSGLTDSLDDLEPLYARLADAKLPGGRDGPQ